MKTQVTIVGGGPVGLTTALELASRGIHCMVIEPRVTLDQARPRAKTVSVRSMEHFRRLGLAQTIRDRAPIASEWSQRATVRTALNGTEMASFDGVFGIRAERDELFAEGAQQIAQPLLELVLREAAAANPAITLFIGATATSVVELDDRVVVDFTNTDGGPASIVSNYVIGADGAQSLVRRQARITMGRGRDLPANLSITFRSTELDTIATGERALHHWIVRHGTQGVLIRLDTIGTWWGTVAGVSDPNSANPHEIIERLVGQPVDAEILATDAWTARIAVADSYATKRIFLAGDAAHLNPPWGGHGFNTGLGDAVNIGWKLAAVLNGWGGPRLLATYEEERRPIAEYTVQVAVGNMRAIPPWLTDAVQSNPTLRGPHGAAIAEEVRRSKHSEFNSLGLVLGYNYSGTPIDPVDYVPSWEPGSRLPHRWLDDGGSLYDLLGDGFALLGDTSEPFATALAAAAAERNVPLSLTRIDADGRVVLVRPDGHVAWAGTADEDASPILDRARGA